MGEEQESEQGLEWDTQPRAEAQNCEGNHGDEKLFNNGRDQ